MANFTPKLGLHANLPAISEGSFLITTDNKEIYVDTNSGRKLISDGRQEVEYIVGTQSTATNAWTGATKDSSLYTGKVIIYKLPQEGTNTPATLKLTLADNSQTSAITILRQGAAVTKHYPAGSTILLVYDGTYWRTDGDYNSDRYISSIAFNDDTIENSSAPLQIDLYVSDTTATISGNLPKVSSASAGVVPKGTAVGTQTQSTKFLREDGSWAVPSYSNAYSLPEATTSTLGGVQIGDNITVSNGIISISSANVTGALGYTPLNNISIAGTTLSASSTTISASDLRSHLGLSQVLTFKGITSAAITDGSNTIPTDLGIANYAPTIGDVVIDSGTNYEYVWVKGDGFLTGRWEKLGGDSSFKTVQEAITSPTANGTATAFIATISQNANGEISATKKTVPTASTSTAGIVTLTSANLITMINQLAVGNAAPGDDDYYVSQYVNGGNTNTNYYRRPVSYLYQYTQEKLGIDTTSGDTNKFLNKKGQWATVSTENTTYTFTSGTSGEFLVQASSDSSATTISIGKPATAGTADKVANTITIGSYVFDGSSAISIPIYSGMITATTAYANGDNRAYGGI